MPVKAAHRIDQIRALGGQPLDMTTKRLLLVPLDGALVPNACVIGIEFELLARLALAK